MTQSNFTPVPWCLKTNLYEVNVRQYSPQGTFAAFESQLERLADLGVETLWFMPITPIGAKKRLGSLGSYYACSSYTKINPEFGDLKDFKRLVKKAHKLKLKVIIDWVANHTGYGHEWMDAFPDYYLKNEAGEYIELNGWEDVADLNYQNLALREAMIESMRFWIDEADIDGFRCDMAHLVPLDFWTSARTYLDKIKPLFWLAETDDERYLTVFDASYAWSWMHASESMIKQQLPIITMQKALLEYAYKVPSLCNKLFFTTNHDENSWNGTEYEKYGQWANAMAVFCATWPGLFLLYSGQEAGNRRRLKFFDKDEIDWSGLDRVENFYRILLALRNTVPAIGGPAGLGQLFMIANASAYCFAFRRIVEDSEVLIYINFGNFTTSFFLNQTGCKGVFKDAFTGQLIDFNNEEPCYLKAAEYLVWVKQTNHGLS